MYPVFAFITLTTLSYGLVLFIRQRMKRNAILDIPNERSLHIRPTLRGGGAAIVVLTLLVVVIYSIITREWQKSWIYLAGGLALALLGWRDDIKSLPARLRLLIQGLVAVGTVTGLGYFDALPFPLIEEIQLGVFGFLLTVVWIVGLTNAFNFMDGIDGIAGGVALAGGIGWMVLILAGAGSSTGLAFYLALAIAATSLGFLGHNWSPARIFMGDVGSVFLGFTFAVLPLLVENKESHPLMLAVLVMWTFIMDAGVTFILRAYRRESLFSAHLSHVYQRLVIGGMKHATVSLFYILLTGLGIILALGWLLSNVWSHWLILIGLPLFWISLSFLVGKKALWQQLSAYVSIVREMGLDWAIFRLGYTLRQKTGMLRHSSPANFWKEAELSTLLKASVPVEPDQYAQYRLKHAPPWFFNEIPPLPKNIPWKSDRAFKDAEKVLAGEWKYFSHQWIKTGFPPRWNIDPISGVSLDPQVHWSHITEHGDFEIKYVWEASRMSMVFTLVRAYAHQQEERFAEAFWCLVEDWMVNNPPGLGANWQNGQEASLRLIALCFGYYAFRKAKSSTPGRVVMLTCLAGALGKYIRQNIDFATYNRNNHAITDSFGMWLCGLVFAELKDANHYREVGRKLLEEQANLQFFKDGGYAMYSLNYHRFVLHIYCLAIRLGELNQQRFSNALYEKLSKSEYLIYQLMESDTGQVPQYGSNDGALVLPLNNCDYTDYRPTLQLVHFLTHGKRLFQNGAWDEDLYWLVGEAALYAEQDGLPCKGNVAFPNAGLFVRRDENSKAILYCADYQARPSHADQLHMDLWWQGINVACDAGTYLYHGQGIWRNGLAGTCVHNTVCVDDRDQMVLLGQFTWANWARGRVVRDGEMDGLSVWQAEHMGYQRLDAKLIHVRSVVALGWDHWLVVDRLEAAQPHTYALQWLLADLPYERVAANHALRLKVNEQWLRLECGIQNGNGEFSIVRADENSTRGWRSQYYGEKSPAISTILTTLSTGVIFWTTFSPENNHPPHLEEITQLIQQLK